MTERGATTGALGHLSRAALWAAALAAVAGLLVACSNERAAPPQATPQTSTAPAREEAGSVREVTIFAINDFHGQLQPSEPVPATIRRPPDANGHSEPPQPAGGIAYLASAMHELRAKRPANVVVGAGDLIGASALPSALLKDEPTLMALGQLGLTVSSFGNHEFDAGIDEIKRKIDGRCPASGCAWPAFRKPSFDYIAANVVDAQTGFAVFKPWVMREAGGVRIAFIGAVTRDTAFIVKPSGIAGVRFVDEADAINAQVPAARAAGADVIAVLIHEGGDFRGPATDPTYRCEGLTGRITDIAPRLDPAIALVVSAHTHQAYTCRIGDRLVTQAGHYGAYVTEVDLKVDTASHRVLDSRAVNHAVLQSRYAPDADTDREWQAVDAVTRSTRIKPIGPIAAPLLRRADPPRADWPAGNLVADAQLAAARKDGPTAIAITNPGGLRADLGEPGSGAATVNLGQLYALQPFGNTLIRMQISGRELATAFEHQSIEGTGAPRLLQISANSRYRLERTTIGTKLVDAVIDGQPLDPARDYWIVVNDFLASGGDGFRPFSHGRAKRSVGGDVDALADYVAAGKADRSASGEARILVGP